MKKPDKPHPEFPLYSHASGKWAKKIRGRLRYFGRWEDPNGALEAYHAFLERNSPSLPVRDAMSLARAANLFLKAKHRAWKAGEIGERTYQENLATCKRLGAFLGEQTLVCHLRPSDFTRFREHREQTLNVVAIGNEITRVRGLFKWLHEAREIDEPMDFGPDFKKPGRRALRRHRRLQGKKLYSADQIRLILDEAGLHLRAMILLGINCGFGPTDCAELPLSAIDLDAGWADYPRHKTEVDRLCPLWPETVSALRASLKRRYKPTEEAQGRVFVKPNGAPWKTGANPELSKYFTAVRKRVLNDGGFYWLRHSFETIGGGAKDQVAVNSIMGHVDSSMAAVYREEIDPERLLAVTNYVRKWLYA